MASDLMHALNRFFIVLALISSCIIVISSMLLNYITDPAYYMAVATILEFAYGATIGIGMDVLALAIVDTYKDIRGVHNG